MKIKTYPCDDCGIEKDINKIHEVEVNHEIQYLLLCEDCFKKFKEDNIENNN